MRIALVHIRHAETGGVERYQNLLASHLAERGHGVTLLCRRHGAPPHPAVSIERLHGFALGKTWRILAFARDVERHLARTPYDVVLGLGRCARQDVLRLGAGLHATYLRLAHDAKLSAFERLTGGGWSRHRLVLALERRAMTAPDLRRVLCNSHFVRRDVERTFGLDPERIAVIHNGVDLSRFRPGDAAARSRVREEFAIPSDALVVLFLGGGFGRKGLDHALRAFARLAARRDDAHLLIVGRDAAPGRFRELARTQGIEARAHWLGERSDAEACYAASDLFLLPSRYDPFANATVEALASGLPVITSTTNGGSEVIDPTSEGAVVDVHRDEDEVAEELGAALLDWSDPSRLPAAARAARARAEEHAAETKLARAEELLRAVAAERRELGLGDLRD